MRHILFALITLIFFTTLFVSPSLAIIKEIENRELPENYTAVLIQLPGIFPVLLPRNYSR
jgi:hypothetical protein